MGSRRGLSRSNRNSFFGNRSVSGAKNNNIISALGTPNAGRAPSSLGLDMDEIVALSTTDVVFADKFKMVSFPSVILIIDGTVL